MRVGRFGGPVCRHRSGQQPGIRPGSRSARQTRQLPHRFKPGPPVESFFRSPLGIQIRSWSWIPVSRSPGDRITVPEVGLIPPERPYPGLNRCGNCRVSLKSMAARWPALPLAIAGGRLLIISKPSAWRCGGRHPTVDACDLHVNTSAA